MSSKQKRPPHEAWDVLERMALHDEAERVAALSDQELDAELAEQGLDPKALREQGEALAAKLKAAAPAPVTRLAVKPTAPARTRWVALLAAATLAAIAMTVAIQMGALVSKGAPDDVEGSTAGDRARAAKLRRDALSACRGQRWADCREGLDEAKALDPAGEESQDVKNARRLIETALGSPNKE
jgi:hypothetical protein